MTIRGKMKKSPQSRSSSVLRAGRCGTCRRRVVLGRKKLGADLGCDGAGCSRGVAKLLGAWENAGGSLKKADDAPAEGSRAAVVEDIEAQKRTLARRASVRVVQSARTRVSPFPSRDTCDAEKRAPRAGLVWLPREFVYAAFVSFFAKKSTYIMREFVVVVVVVVGGRVRARRAGKTESPVAAPLIVVVVGEIGKKCPRCNAPIMYFAMGKRRGVDNCLVFSCKGATKPERARRAKERETFWGGGAQTASRVPAHSTDTPERSGTGATRP